MNGTTRAWSSMAVVGAAGILIGVGVTRARTTGEPPAGDAPGVKAPGMDKKAIASMMAMRGQPSDAHKVLDAMVGDFDMNVSLMMGPGMPPLSIASSSKASWVLGKRFVEIRNAPAPGEELKMESISYLGYDQRTSKYFWWGVDNTDTYCVYAEGDYDAGTKTLTLWGHNTEPGMGEVKFRTRFTLGEATRGMAIDFQANDAMKKMAPAGAIGADGMFPVMKAEFKPRP